MHALLLLLLIFFFFNIQACVLRFRENGSALRLGDLRQFRGAALASRLAQSGKRLVWPRDKQGGAGTLLCGWEQAVPGQGVESCEGLAGEFGVYRQPEVDMDPSFWASVATCF